MVTSLQEYCYFYITKNKYVGLFSLKGQFYLLIYTLNVWKNSSEWDCNIQNIRKALFKHKTLRKSFLSRVYK